LLYDKENNEKRCNSMLNNQFVDMIEKSQEGLVLSPLQKYGEFMYVLQSQLLQTSSIKEAVDLLGIWEGKMKEATKNMNVELPKSLQDAFEAVRAETDENKNWTLITETVDVAAVFSKNLMQIDLNNHIDASIKKATPEVQSEVRVVANEFFNQMQKMDHTEKEHGMVPETWANLSVDHVPNIKDSLSLLKYSVKESVKNLVSESMEQVKSAFFKGTEYLKVEQEKLQSRDQVIERELKDIKDVLLSIDQQLKQLNLGQGNPALDKVVQVQAAMAERSTQISKQVRSPFLLTKIYQNAKQKVAAVNQSVQQVKQAVLAVPERVNQAVRSQTAGFIEAQTNKITRGFDRVIQSLEQRRQAIANRSAEIQKNIVGERLLQPENVQAEKLENIVAAKLEPTPIPDTVKEQQEVVAQVQSEETQKIAEVPAKEPISEPIQKSAQASLQEMDQEAFASLLQEEPPSDATTEEIHEETMHTAAGVSDKENVLVKNQASNQLLELEMVKNAQAITQLTPKSSKKEIYFAHLKDVIQKNPQIGIDDANKKIITVLGQNKFSHAEIKTCVKNSPSLEKCSAFASELIASRIVSQIINPAALSKDVIEAKPVIALKKWASAKEIYASHLKEALKENPMIKTVEADKKITEKLMDKNMDSSRIKECIANSPHVMKVNGYEKGKYAAGIVQDIQRQKQPLQQDQSIAMAR
jgi:hypothetical protein